MISPEESASTPTPQSVVSEQQTVAALQLEVKRANDKLAEWKAKAKSGVDKLREQVTQLTAELDAAKHKLGARASAADAQLPDSATPAIGVDRCPAGACEVNLLLERSVFPWVRGCEENAWQGVWAMAAEVSKAHQSLLRSSLAAHSETHAAFEKYRKRAEQSIKLTSKQHDAAATEAKELRQALDHAIEELKSKDRAIEQRNLAVAAIEKQLDTALYTIDSLRAEMADRRIQAEVLTDGDLKSELISVEEVNVEMERLRREFAEREGTVVQHHHDELQRLVRAHEVEMKLLEDELEEGFQRKLEEDRQSRQGRVTAEESSSNDEAYRTLLLERDGLLRNLKERDTLVAALEKKVAARSGPTAETGAAARDGTMSTSLSPAMLSNRVHELEQQVSSLSEQLWAANNAVLENKNAKRQLADAKGAQRSPEVQQASYLKSIIVKLLCEQADDRRANLIPVLTTLLQLEAEDLRAIYVANPSWMR